MHLPREPSQESKQVLCSTPPPPSQVALMHRGFLGVLTICSEKGRPVGGLSGTLTFTRASVFRRRSRWTPREALMASWERNARDGLFGRARELLKSMNEKAGGSRVLEKWL